MSFWNDITEKVQAGSKVAAAKAKELSQIAQLKTQIVGCDNLLVKNYKELGKAYYEAHKDDEILEYAEYMDTIKDALAKKDDLNAQIAEIKAANPEVAEAADEAVEAADEAVEVAAEVIETAEEAVAEVADDITEE